MPTRMRRPIQLTDRQFDRGNRVFAPTCHNELRTFERAREGQLPTILGGLGGSWLPRAMMGQIISAWFAKSVDGAGCEV